MKQIWGAKYYWLMFGRQELLFIVHHFTAPAFAMYLMGLNGTLRSRSKDFFLLLFTPLLLCEALIISNLFTGDIFAYPDFHYARGPLMPLLYVVGIVYYVLGILEMFRGRKTLNRRNWYFLLLVYTFISASILIQMFFPQIICEYFAESLGVFVFLNAFENDASYYDMETGLFNRHGLIEDMRVAMSAKRPFSLIIIRIANIAKMRNVISNDDFDRLLREFSAHITKVRSIRETAYNYEPGVMVIMGETLDDKLLQLRMESLRESFSDFHLEGTGRITLSATIDAVRVPEDVDSAETIFAMCDDKKGFQDGKVIVRSREEAEKLSLRRIRVREALKRALDDKTLEIYIQPIWWAEDNRIRTGEVLARLHDPQLGLVMPGEFIPIAEESGFMARLGDMILEKTCQYIQKYKPEEFGIEYLEINVSPYQLPDPAIHERFLACMQKYGIPMNRINLEITETYDIETSSIIMKNVQNLRNSCFTFSLDDFGTGYSNFSIISSGIYTNLKVDRSLLLSADKPDGRQLLKTIYTMGKTLGLSIIQEGVETKEQLALVESYGGDMIQGFYFSKPVPAEEFTAYVKEFNIPKNIMTA